MLTPGRTYPLLFNFGILVSGKGFLAAVAALGAALMEREDDGSWWMHGVEPGGLTEPGDTPAAAYLRFNVAFREILFDVASESNSYAEFERKVQEFFHQKDTVDEARWHEAINAFRAGTRSAEAPFTALPKWPSEMPRFVSVQQLNQTDNFSVGDQIPNTPAMPVAA